MKLSQVKFKANFFSIFEKIQFENVRDILHIYNAQK